LASCLALFANSTHQPKSGKAPALRAIEITERSSKFFRADLDFGAFAIREMGAVLEGERSSLRFPASVSRSGRSEPEIDFLSPEYENALGEALRGAARDPAPPVPKLRLEDEISVARLEPASSKKGLRVANGEIWIGRVLAVKVSLMKSKWSEDPLHFWVAYPARWSASERRWVGLFEVQDKGFKKRVEELLRKEYLKRYGGEEELHE
jgi:hypothetical protein